MTQKAGRVFFQHIAYDTLTEVEAAAVILLTMMAKVPKRGVVTGEKSTTSQGWTSYSLRTQM
ncbi:hypothetical protein NSS90_20845 [Bacillus sp. PS93]|uniref:hypothetical protein n=1 Tax=unclassified Bacillus (in: firmicutes) TaxID=185979 RepID=UPI002DB5CE3E|nr:hypothetical protein [Bacillus subtilis]MEC0321456.1 hypothetical protein [Bacillus subtilis]